MYKMGNGGFVCGFGYGNDGVGLMVVELGGYFCEDLLWFGNFYDGDLVWYYCLDLFFGI